MDAPARGGRPRSERARIAILHAVDDLLMEVGYSAMTMKGIAERAGVGRQTVYRWWSNKAEILYEASVEDAEHELAIVPTDDALEDLVAYLNALTIFLEHSPAGIAYRALVGEAQHDPEVATLVASRDFLRDSARKVVARALGPGPARSRVNHYAAILIGPVFFCVMAGHSTNDLDSRALAQAFLRQAGHPYS